MSAIHPSGFGFMSSNPIESAAQRRGASSVSVLHTTLLPCCAAAQRVGEGITQGLGGGHGHPRASCGSISGASLLRRGRRGCQAQRRCCVHHCHSSGSHIACGEDASPPSSSSRGSGQSRACWGRNTEREGRAGPFGAAREAEAGSRRCPKGETWWFVGARGDRRIHLVVDCARGSSRGIFAHAALT